MSLHETAPRVMAAIHPLKVVLTNNVLSSCSVTVPDFPFDASRGSHQITFEPEFYIDSSDFRMVDSEVGFHYYSLYRSFPIELSL